MAGSCRNVSDGLTLSLSGCCWLWVCVKGPRFQNDRTVGAAVSVDMSNQLRSDLKWSLEVPLQIARPLHGHGQGLHGAHRGWTLSTQARYSWGRIAGEVALTSQTQRLSIVIVGGL